MKSVVFRLSQPGVYNWGGYYGPIHSLGYDLLFVSGPETNDHKHASYEVPVEQIERTLSLYM